MAVKPMASINLERKPQGFMNNLSSMAFEWLLIFLLFIDAALSYLLTKLAQYCELQTPCLLCSRLDHVFENEKPEFYQSLLCSNHRMEISSLISCPVHGKLADARRMCEECLMSFAIRTKTTPESFRLLVGKLGVNLDRCGFQSPFLPKNVSPGSLSTWSCSCCSKTWRARSNTQRLLQLPIGFGTLKTNAKPPLPRLPGRGRLTRHNSFKKIRDNIPGPTLPRRLGNTGGDPLSHVGYTELKINSDTESEYPFSDDDDDDRSSVNRENTYLRDSSGSLPKAHTEDLASVNQTQQDSGSEPSLLDQCIQLEVSNPHDSDCLVSDNYMRHGLGELNWEQANSKPYSSAPPDFISLDDVSPSSNVVNGDGISENKSDGPLPYNSTLFMLSELLVPNDLPSSSNVMTIQNGVSPEKLDVHGTKDIGHKSVTKHGEASTLVNMMTVECLNNDHVLEDNAPSISSNLSPSDKCKLSDTDKGRELHCMIAELYERSSSAKLPDQILSVNEIGRSPDDTNPRWNGQHDELQKNDASCTDGIREVQKSPLEKNDSCYESFEGISVSEIEGESSFDRLKRQIEYDRTCLSSLYKELEEERNASEVAADQAMAMITRLQEEKASLHMEALQYLRMMEEQAEYDMEALEKANDLLAEKEKEVQDLEAELEFYRANYPDETKVERLPMETSNSKVDNDKTIKSLFLDFEGEKLYISQCLKDLERNLYPIKSLSSRATQKDHLKEENGFLTPNDLSTAISCTAEGSDSSIEENSDVIEENPHFDSDRSGGIDLIVVENEISELDGRLQALEVDRNLLEHALSSLRNGDDGLQLIKEIAHQLQELRKIRIEKRCPPVS